MNNVTAQNMFGHEPLEGIPGIPQRWRSPHGSSLTWTSTCVFWADVSKHIGEIQEEKSAEYRKQIRERLGFTTLDFRYQDGVDYTRVWDDVIVGSCLQGAADVDWCVCYWLLSHGSGRATMLRVVIP